MATTLYNPFKQFQFDSDICFLTGNKLQSEEESIHVFPAWMMKSFQLEDKHFKMLDENLVTYKSLKLPCSIADAEAIEQMERAVEQSFEQGYDAVKKLDHLSVFQWMTKMINGVVFNEILAGIRQKKAAGEDMNFSQALAHRFTNLHAMLQSLVVPL